MKFGIFYEHQIGRPWEDDTDVRLIHDALERIELADHRAAGRRDPALGIVG